MWLKSFSCLHVHWNLQQPVLRFYVHIIFFSVLSYIRRRKSPRTFLFLPFYLSLQCKEKEYDGISISTRSKTMGSWCCDIRCRRQLQFTFILGIGFRLLPLLHCAISLYCSQMHCHQNTARYTNGNWVHSSHTHILNRTHARNTVEKFKTFG